MFWFIGANLGIIFFIGKILFWTFLEEGYYVGREAYAGLATLFDFAVWGFCALADVPWHVPTLTTHILT